VGYAGQVKPSQGFDSGVRGAIQSVRSVESVVRLTEKNIAFRKSMTYNHTGDENMSASKIAITIDSTLVEELDRLVLENKFPSRSRAIQIAVAEKLKKIHATRLAMECSKLNPELEQSLADEGLNEDLESWPEY